MQVGHEWRAAGTDCCGVGLTGLMLAEDVAVGVADMDFSELGQQVDASAVSGPQFGMMLFAVLDIAGKEGAPFVVGRAL